MPAELDCGLWYLPPVSSTHMGVKYQMLKRGSAKREVLTASDGGDAAVRVEVPPPSAASASKLAGHGRLTWIAITLVLVLGLLLRVWILGRAPVNSDQAVVALMAREILRGHLFAFYWGQSYGGGEPYVVAALFALFGESRLALGSAPILLDAAAALLVWRIGRRWFDPDAAVLAALLFWIWPEVYLYLSTVEYGFRSLALVCGLGVLLFALRLAEPRASRLRDWAALGLFLGVGWWCSPEVVFFAVPALLWLTYRAVQSREWPRPAGVVLFVVMTALGAAPWLTANVGHGYPSVQPEAHLYFHAWIGRLGDFFQHVVPLVLGLRLRGTGDWLVSQGFGTTLYVLFGAAILAWVAVLARERRAAPLVAFVVLFPFAYTYSPFSGFWKDGRYAVYLAPVLALLVASALCELRRGSSRLARAAPVLGVLCALALTAGVAARLAPYVPLAGAHGSRSGWMSWTADPDEWIRPLVSALERAQVRGTYAGYWVAYPLTFESHGRVVAAAPDVNRYPPYLAAVARSSRQAWVFPRASTLTALNQAVGAHPWLPNGTLTLTEFEGYLRLHAIAYDVENAGFFTIVYPVRAVEPTALAEAADA